MLYINRQHISRRLKLIQMELTISSELSVISVNSSRLFAFRQTLQFLDVCDSPKPKPHTFIYRFPPYNRLHSTLFINILFSAPSIVLSCIKNQIQKQQQQQQRNHLCLDYVAAMAAATAVRTNDEYICTVHIHTHTWNSYIATPYTHTVIYFDFDGVCHVSVKINGDRSHSLIHFICAYISNELWTLNTKQQQWIGAFSKCELTVFLLIYFLANIKRNHLIVFLPLLPILRVCQQKIIANWRWRYRSRFESVIRRQSLIRKKTEKKNRTTRDVTLTQASGHND